MTEPTQLNHEDRQTLLDIRNHTEALAVVGLPASPPEQRCHKGFRMVGSPQQLAALFGALAKARGEFPPITKNCTARVFGTTAAGKPFEYTFEYADLGSIVRATAPALAAHGLALVYPLVNIESDFTALVMLVHEGGAFLEAQTTFGAVSGRNGPDDQKTAGRGTYWTRYGVRGLLGIAAEDDDDANGANGNEASITRRDTATKTRGPQDNLSVDPQTHEVVETKSAAQARGRAKAAKAVAEATQGPMPESNAAPLTSETSHALAAAMAARGVGGRIANTWLSERHNTSAGHLTSHPQGEAIGRELLAAIESGEVTP